MCPRIRLESRLSSPPTLYSPFLGGWIRHSIAGESSSSSESEAGRQHREPASQPEVVRCICAHVVLPIHNNCSAYSDTHTVAGLNTNTSEEGVAAYVLLFSSCCCCGWPTPPASSSFYYSLAHTLRAAVYSRQHTSSLGHSKQRVVGV